MSRLIKAASHETEPKKIISIRKLPAQDRNQAEQSNEYEDSMAIAERKKLEANKILQEATSKAEALMAQIEKEKALWEMEKEQLINEAREIGYAEGIRQGKEQGYQEWKEQLELAKETIELSKQDYHSKLEAAEETILALGLKTVEKILSTTLDEDPEHFLPLVKAVLKEAKEYKEVGLHVNPVYYEMLLSRKDELLQLFPREIEFYIYPDEELSAESCIIESPHGRIDASIDRQLAEIKETLFSLLRSE